MLSLLQVSRHPKLNQSSQNHHQQASAGMVVQGIILDCSENHPGSVPNTMLSSHKPQSDAVIISSEYWLKSLDNRNPAQLIT
jgi:hypothetical protein